MTTKQTYTHEQRAARNRVRAQRKQRNRRRIRDFFESQCSLCGYSKNYAALDIHHVNPGEKEYLISELLLYSWPKIEAELKKCVMLCANCHREHHHPQCEL